jgi:hypothetical protein
VELLVECCPSFCGTDNSSIRPGNRCSSSSLVDVGSGEANADVSSCLRLKMTTSSR